MINNHREASVSTSVQQKMKPAASGAADPSSPSTTSADNNSGRRRLHRAPSPATAQKGPTNRAVRHPARPRSALYAGRSRNVWAREALRTADGREREPESRGGAAVHPDGAEADLVSSNRADAVGEDPTDSSAPARRSALRLPCFKGESKLRLLPGRESPLRDKEKKAAEGGGHGQRSGASAGCGPGLGLGLWRGGCLQAELIHFHLQKRLRRSGTKMQTKTENMGAAEAAQGETEPAAEATEAGSVTQQDQALEDEIERLLEENEDLKV